VTGGGAAPVLTAAAKATTKPEEPLALPATDTSPDPVSGQVHENTSEETADASAAVIGPAVTGNDPLSAALSGVLSEDFLVPPLDQ